MSELKITDLVDKDEIDKVKELSDALEKAKDVYAEAAKAVGAGLKLKVEVIGDIDKINTIFSAQTQKAAEGTNALNEALAKQSEVSKKVAESLDELVKNGKLSAKEAKAIADASKKNAEAMEKEAKAEAALNKTRRSTVKTEADRKKIIQEALKITEQEVHSIEEATEANKKMRAAVKMLKDTDEGYAEALGKLNATIGVNTDYVKRNSDRYTQQKMTIGDYKEQMKQAWMEINRGNVSMKNMGIIASSTGKILRSSFSSGVKEIGSNVAGMMKGFIGAQAVISGVQSLVRLFKDGVGTAMDFAEANSRLAAILGTTAKQTKDLQMQARELGSTTKYTAAQATDLQIELAKLGFTTQEIKNSTKYVLRFAQATGSELSEAAALSGAALRMFNADTVETERYVSAMAVATSKSALSFSYLATALPIVGPVAKAFNFTIEDTLALLGKLADSGFDASMSATATRNIFLNLADANGKLAKALGKPVKNLPDLVKGLQELKEKGVDLNTTLELTDKRSVAAFNAFLTAADKIQPLRDQITGVADDLSAMAGEMSNNTRGSLKTLESAWEELMISIYGNTGAIRDFIDTCTEGVHWLTSLVQSADDLAEKQKMQASNLGSDSGSESLKRQTELVNASKDAYIKAGKEETEALEQAKQDRIAILKEQLEKETKLRDEAYDRNQKLWKEKNNASFFKQGLGLEKTDAEFDKEINKSWDEYLSQIAYVKSLEAQISGIERLKADSVKGGGGIETEEDKKKRLKIEQDIHDATISLMEDGLNKEIEIITNGYNKRMAAITGNSEDEKKLRILLGQNMQKDISEAMEKFEHDSAMADTNNRLAYAQKGSQEERDLRMQLANLLYEKEKSDAERTGADVTAIEEKYLNKRQELLRTFAEERIQMIEDNAAAEQAVRDRQYTMDMASLNSEKASGKIDDSEYEERKYQITLDYTRKTAEAVIDSLELELQAEDLSAEERESIYKRLMDEKARLAKEESDLEVEEIDKVTEAEKKASAERSKNLQKWLQASSEAVGTIGNFVSTLYDGQIQKIDEESEKNQEAHDAEIERIQHLEETGAISKEESEARKRAAEAKTEAKEKELEKKRQQLAHKQAIWEKATSIAQAGIATALAITRALPNIPLAALIGAMGAIQIATIIATPIPKYAKGTGNHPGGPAIVGDGGRREAVLTDRGLWITPDVPTLVDLPKNSIVFPDAASIDTMRDVAYAPQISFAESSPTVVNDFSRLEKKADLTNMLLSSLVKDGRRMNNENEMRNYLNSRT